MTTCPITTLMLHSLGDIYAPIEVNGAWRLVNSSGGVLSGMRGNAYNFKSFENARFWLCSNLSRFKNADTKTSDKHIVKIATIYAETGADYLQVELNAIASYAENGWQIIECSQTIELTEIDGGNAFSVYELELNP